VPSTRNSNYKSTCLVSFLVIIPTKQLQKSCFALQPSSVSLKKVPHTTHSHPSVASSNSIRSCRYPRYLRQVLARHGRSNLWSHVLDPSPRESCRESRTSKQRRNFGCCYDGGGSAPTIGGPKDSTFQQHVNHHLHPKCFGGWCRPFHQRLFETRRLRREKWCD